MALDLADDDSVASLVAETVERFGRIDVWHNNAAATVMARAQDGDVAEMDLDVWDHTMRVNHPVKSITLNDNSDPAQSRSDLTTLISTTR